MTCMPNLHRTYAITSHAPQAQTSHVGHEQRACGHPTDPTHALVLPMCPMHPMRLMQAMSSERAGMEEALRDIKAKDNILPKLMACNPQVDTLAHSACVYNANASL